MLQDDQQRREKDLKQCRKDLERYQKFSATEWRDLSTRYDRYALAVCGGGFVLFLHLLISVTASSIPSIPIIQRIAGFHAIYAYMGMINLILLLFLISITLTLARKAFAIIVHIQTLKAIEQGKPINIAQAQSWAAAATNICLYSSAITMLAGLATAFILFSNLLIISLRGMQ